MGNRMRIPSFLLVIILVLGASLALAPSSSVAGVGYTFTPQEPPPCTNMMFAVSAVDATHVWAAGGTGSVFFYDGESWMPVETGSGMTFDSAFALDADNVWLGGRNGTVMYFNGSTWESRNVPESFHVFGIHFADATHGWAAGSGGNLYWTDNGGVTWTENSLGSNDYEGVKTIIHSGRLYIWAIGANGAYAFQNYDVTGPPSAIWQVPVTPPPVTNFHSIDFFDHQKGWIVGASGTIYRTDDGGSEWLVELSGTGTELLSVSVLDSDHAWASGSTGGAYYREAVSTWTAHATGASGSIYGIEALDATHVWGVGWTGTYQPSILVFFDGASWTQDEFPDHARYNAISAYDTTNAWIAGDPSGTVPYFNGTEWVDIGPGGGGQNIWDVDAYDPSHIWIVGDSGLVYMYDGGSWVNHHAAVPAVNYQGVAALDATHVWIAGDDMTIAFYNGTGWTTQLSNPGAGYITGICAVSDQLAWACGYYPGGAGFILSYNGTDWTPVATPTLPLLTDITASSPSDAWAVGNGGAVLTYDGSWNLEPPVTGDNLNGVSALNPSNVWVVGDNGTIVRYDGTAWQPATSGTTHHLRGVEALDTSHIWAVGASSTILLGSANGPRLDTLSAVSGYPGSAITLNGGDFDDVRGTSVVHFGAFAPAESDYLAWGNNSIQVRVPQGAYGGPIPVSVETRYGTSGTTNFYVAPYITGVSPTYGHAGSTYVTVSGRGFGPTQLANSSVWFGSSKSTVYSSWSNNSVRARVGAGANSQVHVKMMASCCWSNARAFDVRPVINSISPTSGAAGTTLIISGSAFCNTQGSGLVCFRKGDGSYVYPTSYISWKQTQVKVPVPASFTGTVQVKIYTLGGMSNGVNFTRI